MRGRASVLVVILLAGCASLGGTEHQKATFEANTTKLDYQYASCVLAEWVKISPKAHKVEVADGFRIIVPNATTDIEELLIIRSKVDGAQVTLHERVPVLALRTYRNTAHACL